MAPKKNNNKAQANGAAKHDDNGITFTPGEANLINAIFTHGLDKPNVNWEACASELGLKNPKVAKDRFNQVVRKFNWFRSTTGNAVDGGAASEAAAVAPAPPKTARATRSASARFRIRSNLEEFGVGEVETPSKKRKLDAEEAPADAEVGDKEDINVKDKANNTDDADAKDESKAEEDVDVDA